MLKIIIVLIIIIIPINVKSISASSYVVADLNSNRILESNNKDEKRLIASVTKIMTSIVTIENSDIKKSIIVKDNILKSTGSSIYLEVGEEITIEDLLYGLMLRSGNDAAIAISTSVYNKMEDFVAKMNEYARVIGMKNTNFVNPHGLEENDGRGNISTAYDMALLTSYAMKNKTFRLIFGTKYKTVKTNYKSYTWKNKNRILHTYDYVTGGKTGFTEKARRTLVTTATKDNKNVVVVTLNDGNDFQDHIDLYEKVFKNYENVMIIDKNNYLINNDNYCQDCNLYIKDSFSMMLKKSEINDIGINVNLLKQKKFKNNQIVGYLEIKFKDEIVKNIDIYINKENKRKSLWDIIKGWFKW